MSFRFAKVQIEPHLNRLSSDERECVIEPLVMDALVIMLRASPSPVPNEQFLETLWPGRFVDNSALHRVMSKLRSAFRKIDADPKLIETLHRRGYRIRPEAEVFELSEPVAPKQLPTPSSAKCVLFILPPNTSGKDEVNLGSRAKAIRDALTEHFIKLPGIDVTADSEGQDITYRIDSSLTSEPNSMIYSARLVRASDQHLIWSYYSKSQHLDAKAIQGLALQCTHLFFAMLKLDQFTLNDAAFTDISEEARLLNTLAEQQYVKGILGQNGNWTLYLNLLKRAVKLEPDFKIAQISLANCYMQRLGNLSLKESQEGAHSSLRTLKELYGNEPDEDLYLQEGQILMNLDLDYVGATYAFENCLELNPCSKWSYFGLSRIALREGRVSEMQSLLATAAEIHSAEEESLFLLAQAYFLHVARDYRGAMDVCKKVLPLYSDHPSFSNVYQLIASSLIYSGELEAAKLILDELDEKASPQDLDLILIMAMLGATRRAATLMRTRTNCSEPYMEAIIWQKLGEEEKMYDQLQVALNEHEESMFDAIRLEEHWDPLRQDPRFQQFIDQVESKERRVRPL